MSKYISNIKIWCVLMLTFCFTAQVSYSQRPIVPSNACLNPNGGERAHFYVKSFLTFADSQNARIETNATNETVDQIQSVSDPAICAALNQIIQNTPKYKNIDDNIDAKSTKYFYRTNNIFYIFWTRKPEYDDIPNTGPQKLFIVVSADYQNIWEYYF